MFSIFKEPELLDVNVDSIEFLNSQRMVLKRKDQFKRVLIEFYQRIVNIKQKCFKVDGRIIEIGSGISFLNEYIPTLEKTDIKPDPALDRTLDAMNMDLPNSSTKLLIGINCFHHFPDAKKFFTECIRVLKPGGGVILIEPYYGVLSAILYKRLFKTESFDKNQKGWILPQSAMIGANQALSYIVFVRDKKLFMDLFPELEIIEVAPLNNGIRYLVSGGLNFKQLFPNRLFSVFRVIEIVLTPIIYLWGLHQIVVIRKK